LNYPRSSTLKHCLFLDLASELGRAVIAKHFLAIDLFASNLKVTDFEGSVDVTPLNKYPEALSKHICALCTQLTPSSGALLDSHQPLKR
jgi:hypothetical protein